MGKKDGYHHGDLGSALSAAVRALIERDGLAHFSIAEACKSLGVSTAAPYKHFADKQDILRHVAKSGFEDLTRAMARARDAEPRDARRRIAGIGKAYVDFALANPGTFKLMFGSTPNVKEDEAVCGAGHACFDVLISEVARHLGSSDTSEDSRQLSVILWTFVHGVASLAMDKDYDAARICVHTHGLIDAATVRLLHEEPTAALPR